MTAEEGSQPATGHQPDSSGAGVEPVRLGPGDGGPIRAWVRERAEAIVALLAELVAIDSTTGREDELARWCAAWLAAHRIDVRLEPCKGRHNVVAWVDLPAGPRAWAPAAHSGDRAVPTLVLSGHLDTVPADVSAWSRPPHAVRIAEGRLYGLGASDLKASIAAAFFAQLYLSELAGRAGRSAPGTRVVSAFTIEEETTGDGTRLFLERALNEGFLDPRCTAAIVTEPTGLRELCIANAAPVFVELELRGRGGHGSRPHQALNPLPALCALITELPALERAWAAAFGDPTFPELARPTLTPTAVAAGDPARQNVIPQVARCVLDLRVPQALYANDFARLDRELEAWIGRARAALGGVAGERIELTWRVRNRREGHRLAPEHPLVAAALGVLRGELGLDPRVRATTAGNDAVFFGLHGIPALNKIGPGHPECAHRPDEFVSIENVLVATEFFIRMALAGGP